MGTENGPNLVLGGDWAAPQVITGATVAGISLTTAVLPEF